MDKMVVGDPGVVRLSNYALEDNLLARDGRVFLTGTQALVRLPLMQRWLDRERGLDTAGFISGYRGSPLGGYDQALWRARGVLEAQQIRFLPAINEELAATAVLGSQQVETDPERTVAGVFALWYGKGPGVDRAGDALKHGNVYGASPHGGVLVVAGDDHGCVSSSMPHQSDFAMQGWNMPIVNPASIADYLEFGLYGWALSRFSGMWVGFKAISETVESGATVDLDAVRTRFEQPPEYTVPAGGLHYRWPDLPGLPIETRHAHKLAAVHAFARANAIDRLLCPSPAAEIGIVTCGKAHLDVLEALRRLGLGLDALERAGVRLYKVGLSYPLEPTRLGRFKDGLKEILVIEEKGPVVEQQIRNLFYNLPDGARPLVLGKLDAGGAPLLPAQGELRPSRVAGVLAAWLARHHPGLDRRALLPGFAPAAPLSNAADGVRRLPYFCSGCPHNSSTKVPAGSRAQAGIGCHFMASWMERDTTGLIQMGGEGVDWVAHSMFSATPHVFQNLGDGTYFHSGFLAIRQAIAGRANITYKILYNDAVAMTGGQPIDGNLAVDAIAWQVHAEGARAIAVVSDAPEKYAGLRGRFPPPATFHGRDELDAVQRRLREIAGVTVLIYDQTCSAELRRRRKKKQLPEPARRLVINSAVCEGCGDCGAASNCMSLTPLETDYGRKRAIDQSSCNKDYSCADGFCPSFVSVRGGALRKAAAAEVDPQALRRAAAALPAPAAHAWQGPYNLLVTGVGGTGVVTVGALVSMAAHLEGKQASVLDFMGFAQKGGAVLSFVRLALAGADLHQARIDVGQSDAMLACDMVVGAGADALQTLRHGHTRVVANTHRFPTAAMVRDPDAPHHAGALMDKLHHAVGAERVAECDGQALARQLMGDTVTANILLMGFAWQRGLIPVGLAALERAIALNGVAVDANLTAFAAGRLAASGAPLPRGLAEAPAAPPDDSLEALVARRGAMLARYQNAALAAHFEAFVARVRERERAVLGAAAAPALSLAVARNYSKLLAYKDEYEVARLFSDGQFQRELRQQFEGDLTLTFHMAPPLLGTRKRAFGPWLGRLLPVLAKGKCLRGTRLDVFGYSAERRRERQLIGDYAARLEALLPRLTAQNLAAVVALAELPQTIRGYGHVKLASIDAAEQRAAALLAALDQPVPPAAAVTAAPPARPPMRTIAIRRYQ
ncbi:indolepyruvate ferredoxin oxidoreductase [Duganella sp. 1411]|nr:indolepyruvate ferredoxin oxidoreductase [Duganella sp. 1411]